jgi:hypothetical protein
MNNKMLKAAVAGVALSVSSLANAGLIVDNGTDTVNIGGSCSSCGTSSWQVFDDFTLGSFQELDYLSVDFSTKNYDNVEFSIWNSNLTTKLFSFNYAWSLGTFVTNVDSTYDNVTANIDLGNASLNAGQYYLSLWGTDTYVMRSGGGSHLQFSSSNLSDYSNQPQNVRTSDLHFRLHSDSVDVPEPTTLAIFALGIMGLASRRFSLAKKK